MTIQEINNLDGEAAERLCDQLGLDTSGDDDELRERLANHYNAGGKSLFSPWLGDATPLSITTMPFNPRKFTPAEFSELVEKERSTSTQLATHICNSGGSSTPATTPDGLTVYKQEGVGLVVSAAEHNFKLSEWQAREADLMRVLKHAEESSRAHQDRVAELMQPSAMEMFDPTTEIEFYKAEVARLERRLDAALDIICNEWGYTRERASAWLDDPNSD